VGVPDKYPDCAVAERRAAPQCTVTAFSVSLEKWTACESGNVRTAKFSPDLWET